MTEGQSASLSWCQAPIWDPRRIFLVIFFIILFRQLMGLLIWDVLSDERSGLYFSVVAGPRQRNLYKSYVSMG
jgi:hypothetical protein